MALIICPECGKQISNTAKQCIHCGCEIMTCPECNEVYVGKVEECKNCGFQFVEKTESKPVVPAKENCIDYYNKWKSESVLNQIMHSSALIYLLLALVSLVLFFVAFGKIWNWSGQISGSNNSYSDLYSGMNALANTSAIKSSVKTLFVLSFIIFFVEMSMSVLSTMYVSSSLRSWFLNNKIDLSASIKDYLLTTDFSLRTKQGMLKEKIIFSRLVSACVNDDVVVQEKARNAIILEIILLFVASLCLGIFFVGNVDGIMSYVLLNGKISFKCIENWWAIVAGVATYLVCTFRISNKTTKTYMENKEFIKNNMPEGYSNFNSYLGF